MSNSSVDRNVLFGVMAWQLGIVERRVLMEAMYACMVDKSKPLPDYLTAAGLLDEADRRWLEQAVERQLRKHGDDAGATLAEIGSADAVCRELRSIALSDAAATMDSQEAVDRHAPTLAPVGTMHDDDVEIESGDGRSPETDRFRIVRPHARGGLGEVFVAVDEELKREVALKQILERHADNRISRTRFLMEAEVTGNLEHPGVVPVYGLGTQNDGRPYYAMRFIRGESLEDAIRKFHGADDDPLRDPGERALELRNLLSRFVAVCNTIEYAHSRGYVHRDIKPENIMLGPYGETLVVDWGLARPMEQPDVELDCHSDVLLESTPPPMPGTPTGERPTQMGAVVGTPQFMSPEQASGRLDLIRAPADVYSLGATLYCLLTDQPAFVASDVRKVLRDVREGRFPPPRQVKRDVPRGLEAICLKAMAHDPAQRYPSARALADDVEHWLADEPVSALPETSAQRLQRWLRRHKTWTRSAAAALVVVAVVAGVAYVREAGLRAAVQRALDLEAVARREADEARTLADRNADLAQQERRRAEDHAHRAEQQSALALDTLKSVLFDIQAKLKNVPAAHTVRLSMLNTVVDGLKRVARSLETAADTDHSLVRAYLDLGDIFLQVGTSDGTSASAEARSIFERGVETASNLIKSEPQDAQARAALAAAYRRMGDVARQSSNLTEAGDWFLKSRDLWRQLTEERPADADAQRELAALIQRLGLVREGQRNLEEAKSFYLQFFELSELLAQRDPENAEDRRNLSVSYERMGDISLLQEDPKSAEEYFRKSLQVRRKLVAADEQNALAKRDLSVTLDRLGGLALDRSDAEAAADFYHQSLLLRQALYDADPNNLQSLRDLLVSYAALGDTALGVNDLESAAKNYRRYHGIAEKLLLADPDNRQFQRDLATAFYRQGDVMLRLGDVGASREFFGKYYQLMKQLSVSDPAAAALRDDLMRACAMLGELSLQLNDVAEARRYLAEYLVEARRRADERPSDAVAAHTLIDALLRNGDLHVRLLDLTSADRDLNAALQMAQKNQAAARSPTASLLLASGESLLAQLELERRDPEKAARWVQSALERLRAVAAADDSPLRSQAELLLQEQQQLPGRCETARRAAADVRFVADQPPALVPDLLDFAAAAQLRRGAFDEAEQSIEQLIALQPKSGDHLVAAARRYAAAAGGIDVKPGDDAAAVRRKKYLDRAVTLLREADAAGAFDDVVLSARLEFASDFAVLKDRREYVELVERVRQRRNPTPPKTA